MEKGRRDKKGEVNRNVSLDQVLPSAYKTRFSNSEKSVSF